MSIYMHLYHVCMHRFIVAHSERLQKIDVNAWRLLRFSWFVTHLSFWDRQVDLVSESLPAKVEVKS